MLSSVSVTLCATGRAYANTIKAYWHMNFMGVAPAKIIFVVILSFEVALVSFTNIIIITKRINEKVAYKENFVISRSIGIK